jgi:hypothetical protein
MSVPPVCVAATVARSAAGVQRAADQTSPVRLPGATCSTSRA